MQIPLIQMVVRVVVISRLVWAVLSWIGRSPARRRPWVIITLVGVLAVLMQRNRSQYETGSTPMRVSRQSADGGSDDDLTMIEGIGAKIAAALNAAGINTFAQLARATEPELRTALASAGMRFAPSLSTWSQQAEYARRGEWDTLKSYKDVLTAGRE